MQRLWEGLDARLTAAAQERQQAEAAEKHLSGCRETSDFDFPVEPLDGIEPSTYSLRVNCSTPELQRRLDDGRNKSKPMASRKAEIRAGARSVRSCRPGILVYAAGHGGFFPDISRNRNLGGRAGDRLFVSGVCFRGSPEPASALLGAGAGGGGGRAGGLGAGPAGAGAARGDSRDRRGGLHARASGPRGRVSTSCGRSVGERTGRCRCMPRTNAWRP